MNVDKQQRLERFGFLIVTPAEYIGLSSDERTTRKIAVDLDREGGHIVSIDCQIEAAFLQIRSVLMQEWDPIGVRFEPKAHDEYDSYVGPLYLLLTNGASEQGIVDHLLDIETSWMGLQGQSKSTLFSVAISLKRVLYPRK